MTPDKTTMRNLINEINFTDKKVQTHPDWENLSSIYDIYDLGWSDDERLKCYHIQVWQCTDSWVGINAYFLDDKFVCLSQQSSRKSTPEFEFISKDASDSVHKYLSSLRDIPDPTISILSNDDLDTEIESTFSTNYSGEIIHKTGKYRGHDIKILNTRYSHESGKYFHTVEIEYPDGKKDEVDNREIKLAFNNLD